MKRAKIQNEYMFDTKVENIFINEYLPSAPDNFVKVYLVALMYVDLGKTVDDEEIAKTLHITEKEVKKAWKYWYEIGAIKKEQGEVVFCRLKENLYGIKKTDAKITDTKRAEAKAEATLHVLDDKATKQMFAEIEKLLKRPLNGSETSKILEWIDALGATPQVIVCAYKHCKQRNKERANYVAKVVEDWTNRGFKTAFEVERYLEDVDQRYYEHNRIMKALGFGGRNPSEAEVELMDKWLDEFGYSLQEILEACKKTTGISSPSMNYINKVLENKKKKETGKDLSGKVTRAHVLAYYGYIKDKAEKEAQIRKEEVYAQLPQIKEMEEKIKNNYMALTKALVSGGEEKQKTIQRIRTENTKLTGRIEAIFTENGIPTDYVKPHYRCPICKDTGIMEDGTRCKCYSKIEKEAADWQPEN